MKQVLFTFLAILSICKSFSQQEPDSLLKKLTAREQTQMDAIATGNKVVWADALHDSVIFTTEDGSNTSKAKFIEDLKPLPSGYKGVIKIKEPKLKVYGNTAILSFINDEYLELYGQHIHTQYRQTDTWLNENGSWKIIAMMVFEIPRNPPPVTIAKNTLKKYIGSYQLSADRKALVKVENGKLYVVKNNGKPVELLPETENMFFREGDGRVNVFFIRDNTTGKYKMIERREGEDLVWKQ